MVEKKQHHLFSHFNFRASNTFYSFWKYQQKPHVLLIHSWSNVRFSMCCFTSASQPPPFFRHNNFIQPSGLAISCKINMALDLWVYVQPVTSLKHSFTYLSKVMGRVQRSQSSALINTPVRVKLTLSR